MLKGKCRRGNWLGVWTHLCRLLHVLMRISLVCCVYFFASHQDTRVLWCILSMFHVMSLHDLWLGRESVPRHPSCWKLSLYMNIFAFKRAASFSCEPRHSSCWKLSLCNKSVAFKRPASFVVCIKESELLRAKYLLPCRFQSQPMIR